MSSCSFEVKNDGPGELLLYLEPEGAEFLIPSQESVQVELIGADRPVVMNHSLDPRGRVCISLWPAEGTYQVLYKGKNVLDLL
jgi:hypothetical protein